jgi:hypothetical protein
MSLVRFNDKKLLDIKILEPLHSNQMYKINWTMGKFLFLFPL